MRSRARKAGSAALAGADRLAIRLSPRAALWLVPVLLVLHNAEEALLMARALPLQPDEIPGPLGRWIPSVSYRAFLVALLIVTAVPLLAAVFGRLERPAGGAVYTLLAAQAVMLLNVASHLAAAVALGGYAPGLGTALVVNLPFSLYLLRRASRDGWLSRWQMRTLPPVAVLVHGPGLLGLLLLVGRLWP